MTRTPTAPSTGFVDRIRALLDDLDEETRTDLVEGLEADLRDLVAERGAEALPEPERYADELRAPPGCPPVGARPAPRPGASPPAAPGAAAAQRFDALCDRWRDRFLARAAQPRVAPAWSLARAVRPAWLGAARLPPRAGRRRAHRALGVARPAPAARVWMLGPAADPRRDRCCRSRSAAAGCGRAPARSARVPPAPRCSASTSVAARGRGPGRGRRRIGSAPS